MTQKGLLGLLAGPSPYLIRGIFACKRHDSRDIAENSQEKSSWFGRRLEAGKPS
jgi:hypothetical protein